MRASVTSLLPFALILCSCSSGVLTSKQTGASVSHSLASVQAPASEVVLTYQELATNVGYRILSQGGNAFDVFVAATAVQYVLAPGVTSFAGPLGALLYDSQSRKVIYLDATLNEALDPRHKWDASHPHLGTAALVPGAVAGLEAISKKYGKLSFKTVLMPAIELAEAGFPLDAEYAGILKSTYGQNLKRSPYAQMTYFKNGQPLQTGEILKQPVVALFLRNLAAQGSTYVYRGEWMKNCIKAVNAEGGHLRAQDFQSYHPVWSEPIKASYRSYDIFSSNNYGGMNTLLSLKVLEHADLSKYGKHYTKSAEGLATLATVTAEVSSEPWLNNDSQMHDSDFIASKLSDSTSKNIWGRVLSKISSNSESLPGSHSYQIVVIDKDGNAITGTNTIESFPWGNDIFVAGIPLTASGSLPFATAPGKRRKSPLSMQFGFKEEKLKFAVGAFSSSLLPAEFQFIVNVVDYHLSAHDAVSTPRFGSLAWDFSTGKPATAYWLDARIGGVLGKEASDKFGVSFTQEGYIDTGLGNVAIINDDGTIEGAIAPMTSIGQSATKSIGIGIILGTNQNQEVFIQKVLPESPAEKGDVKSGDVIIAIQTNMESPMRTISGMVLTDVQALIRGPVGTPVSLTVRRDAKVLVLHLIRSEIGPH